MAAKKKTAAKKTGRSWELSIFLMKESVTSWKEALAEPKRKSPPPHEDIANVGTLVIKDSPERTPEWVELLLSHSTRVASLRQRSPGAVLFVKSKKRLFALTFGYGRSLLAPDRLVHDFGMRVVLNSVDPSRLRSIDVRTLEADPLMSRKQYGEGRPLKSFGVDQYRDLLRGVAGSPGDKKPVISGSDAVHVRVNLKSITDVAAECGQLLSISSADTYQKDFAWIDHVRLVRDPAIKTELEAALFNECASSNVDSIGFMVPDIIDGHQIERLRGSWARTDDATVNGGFVRERLKKKGRAANTKSFITAVKSDRIGEPSRESGKLTHSWSLLDCLVWNTTVSNKRYVLSAGDWFELDGNFIAAVESAFDALVAHAPPVTLPAATKLKLPEKSYYELEYNKSAANKNGLANLDRTNMMRKLAATGVEPCDLLHPGKGMFIHVKDGTRSSLMSHLFNQGVVSLEGFLSVAEARNTLRSLAGIAAKGKGPLQEPISPSRLKVVFAVIAKKPASGKWRLPFFSMLAAKHAAERIEQRQATPYIVRVDDKRS